MLLFAVFEEGFTVQKMMIAVVADSWNNNITNARESQPVNGLFIGGGGGGGDSRCESKRFFCPRSCWDAEGHQVHFYFYWEFEVEISAGTREISKEEREATYLSLS